MKMKVIEEKENPFLERKELTIELEHTGEATPQRDEVIKNVASTYKVDENCVDVGHIFTKKGISKSIAIVKIYKKPIVRKKKEPKVKEEEPKEEKKEKPSEKSKEGEKVEAQTSKAK